MFVRSRQSRTRWTILEEPEQGGALEGRIALELARDPGATAPRPLAELFYRRTAGNPLFAHELLRYLIAEGRLEERDGALHRVGGESPTGGLTEDLSDTVALVLLVLGSMAIEGSCAPA